MRILLASILLMACGGQAHTSDDGGLMDSAVVDAAHADASFDAGAPLDAANVDGGETDSAIGDAGNAVDSGTSSDDASLPMCGDGFGGGGACSDPGLMCLCCPAGGPTENCTCTTACTSDGECTDLARPHCNRPMGGPGGSGPGICTTDTFHCVWGAVCASPDTPIATPDGERPIAELQEGDLVYSVEHGAITVVPIARVSRTPVVGHQVMHVELANGRVLEISGGHPTADGRWFSDLASGGELDGVRIVDAAPTAYVHSFTYDILPRSETGQYYAAGVLIGSTLAQ